MNFRQKPSLFKSVYVVEIVDKARPRGVFYGRFIAIDIAPLTIAVDELSQQIGGSQYITSKPIKYRTKNEYLIKRVEDKRILFMSPRDWEAYDGDMRKV